MKDGELLWEFLSEKTLIATFLFPFFVGIKTHFLLAAPDAVLAPTVFMSGSSIIYNHLSLKFSSSDKTKQKIVCPE